LGGVEETLRDLRPKLSLDRPSDGRGPEALVVLAAEVARRDPRLFDEMFDWLSRKGRLLSVQRLRNLVGRFPVEARPVEAVVAWVGEPAPAVQWLSGRARRGSPAATR
jgi:hypothetical protein